MSPAKAKEVIGQMGAKKPFMPPFPGSKEEADLMADYLARGLKGQKM